MAEFSSYLVDPSFKNVVGTFGGPAKIGDSLQLLDLATFKLEVAATTAQRTIFPIPISIQPFGLFAGETPSTANSATGGVVVMAVIESQDTQGTVSYINCPLTTASLDSGAPVLIDMTVLFPFPDTLAVKPYNPSTAANGNRKIVANWAKDATPNNFTETSKWIKKQDATNPLSFTLLLGSNVTKGLVRDSANTKKLSVASLGGISSDLQKWNISTLTQLTNPPPVGGGVFTSSDSSGSSSASGLSKGSACDATHTCAEPFLCDAGTKTCTTPPTTFVGHFEKCDGDFGGVNVFRICTADLACYKGGDTGSFRHHTCLTGDEIDSIENPDPKTQDKTIDTSLGATEEDAKQRATNANIFWGLIMFVFIAATVGVVYKATRKPKATVQAPAPAIH